MSLQGKVGIITAAASGMGRAGAEIFARKDAAVAIVDRDEQAINQVAEEIKQKGGKTLAISADLKDDTMATGIVDQATSEFGCLDFVWNHLGHPGPATVEGVNMAEYELACDLKMRAQLVTTEAAIPHMQKRGAGSLVYTASNAGIKGSPMSPGPIDTPMLRVFVNRPDSSPDAPGRTPDEVENLVAGRASASPLGRYGQPHEVANAALFQVSDDASYVTGVAVPVDGGITA